MTCFGTVRHPARSARAGIFILCSNVCLRDWRILKRFMGRKWGIAATKRENFLDLYRLLQWNHKSDVDNLKRAMDFIREFESKAVVVVVPMTF